ncbi:hypothetical protein Tco_0603742 [Tanacetum coccineum]
MVWVDAANEVLAKESKRAWIYIKAGGRGNCHMSCGPIAHNKISTGTLHFSLSMERNAVIPAHRKSECQLFYRGVNIATNDDERAIDLVHMEEKREQRRPYVRKKQTSHARRHRKARTKVEDPTVTKPLGKGAYKLRDMDGVVAPHVNICNLNEMHL